MKWMNRHFATGGVALIAILSPIGLIWDSND